MIVAIAILFLITWILGVVGIFFIGDIIHLFLLGALIIIVTQGIIGRPVR